MTVIAGKVTYNFFILTKKIIELVDMTKNHSLPTGHPMMTSKNSSIQIVVVTVEHKKEENKNKQATKFDKERREMIMYEEICKPVAHIMDAFENRLLSDCLKKLDDHEDDLRFNSFGGPFRELIRNILERLAPDDEVKQCSWFVMDGDKITRKQRVIYAIKGGLDDQFIKDELEIDVSQATAKLRKVIDDLNRLTHINASYYDRKPAAALLMVTEAISFLVGVLTGIEDTRLRIIKAYEDRLHDLITSAVIGDVINEIDTLATHYFIDGVLVEEIHIVEINSLIIKITVSGSIDVVHQYGSDGDLSRGNGAEMESTYPYKVKTSANVANPLDIEIETEDIRVDNSSFYGKDTEYYQEYEQDDEETEEEEDFLKESPF
jgi:hypothetical protein